jgi:hypothetical protein
MLQKVPYTWIYIIAVALLFGASFFIPESNFVVPEVQISDRAKATIDYLFEMGKIVAALNTAVFSAAAALTVKGKDWSAKWGRLEGILVVVALVCGAWSYYGIYLGHIAALGMVYAGTINPFESRLSIAFSIQYYGTLIGIFLLGLVFARMLEGWMGASMDKRPATNR